MNGNDTGIVEIQTMEPIALESIPSTCTIKNGLMICDHRPLKKEKN